MSEFRSDNKREKEEERERDFLSGRDIFAFQGSLRKSSIVLNKNISFKLILDSNKRMKSKETFYPYRNTHCKIRGKNFI